MASSLRCPELPCASCGKKVPVMLETFRVHCGVCISMSRGVTFPCEMCYKPIYTSRQKRCFRCSQTDCTDLVFASARVN